MNLPNVWNYWAVIALMMLGLYIVIAKTHYVKKLMGLSLFQVSVIMLYVSMGRVTGGTAPIYILEDGAPKAFVVYTNPVPHVLMLTAIVVGVATMAVGLALVVRIREAYGSSEEDVVSELDRRELEEAAALERAAREPAPAATPVSEPEPAPAANTEPSAAPQPEPEPA